MVQENNNLYKLLKKKEIIAILNGDTKYDDYKLDDGSTIKVAMPYLSGPNLCEISTLFGLPMTYTWNGINFSRSQYLDNLFEYCIKENKCSDLLAYLFGKEQFSKILKTHKINNVEIIYNNIVQIIIQKINEILNFGGNELVIIGSQFIVRKIDSKIEVQTPKIKSIDREYIKSISYRAMQDIEQGNYDSAITKSRTLLEEVFCYVIEKKSQQPEKLGDINSLYKQVRNLYNMHTDTNVDKRINILLSGLNSIVSAIAEMRNKDSDAHGVGATRIGIDEHHARLFVNSSMTMSDFILSVSKKSIGKNDHT